MFISLLATVCCLLRTFGRLRSALRAAWQRNIGGKTLVVHGGLSRHRGVQMSHLRRLSSRQQCPEAPQSFEDYLFFDLMWSDPHPDDVDGVLLGGRADKQRLK